MLVVGLLAARILNAIRPPPGHYSTANSRIRRLYGNRFSAPRNQLTNCREVPGKGALAAPQLRLHLERKSATVEATIAYWKEGVLTLPSMVNRMSPKPHTGGVLKAMETEEELNTQLNDIVARIDEASRELKALRRHPAEGSKGKGRATFITGKERMIAAAEAARQLDDLKQREQGIRAKLHSENR